LKLLNLEQEVPISIAKKAPKPKEILGSRPTKLKSLDERNTDLNKRYVELLNLREEVQEAHARLRVNQ
jgi:hypothetical protein